MVHRVTTALAPSPLPQLPAFVCRNAPSTLARPLTTSGSSLATTTSSSRASLPDHMAMLRRVPASSLLARSSKSLTKITASCPSSWSRTTKLLHLVLSCLLSWFSVFSASCIPLHKATLMSMDLPSHGAGVVLVLFQLHWETCGCKTASARRPRGERLSGSNSRAKPSLHSLFGCCVEKKYYMWIMRKR